MAWEFNNIQLDLDYSPKNLKSDAGSGMNHNKFKHKYMTAAGRGGGRAALFILHTMDYGGFISKINFDNSC